MEFVSNVDQDIERMRTANQRDILRAHFKLDWHKYNIKQMLLQRDTVKEDVFDEIISGDVSSISGSDSESDSDEATQANKYPKDNPLMTLSLNQNDAKENDIPMIDNSNPKIYFVNCSGNFMSVYRQVVFAAKDFSKTSEEIEYKIKNLSKEKVWLIAMTGGGHFAGSIFSGNNVIVRKTFHRYTVRAKRGTAQGIRDNKQGGHQPKSAGASLRRYNETALAQDIQNLLESWSEHIKKCDRIFIRVPSSYKWIFFAGKKPPFKKDDSRIRKIPFATRRATFKELEKVHGKLSTVEVHEEYLEDVDKKSPQEENKMVDIGQSSYGENVKLVINKDVNVNTTLESDKQLEMTEENREENIDQKEEFSKKLWKKNLKDKQCQKLSQRRTKSAKQTESKEKEVITVIWFDLYEAINSGNDEKVIRIVGKIDKDNAEGKTSISLEQDDEKTKRDLITEYNKNMNNVAIPEFKEDNENCTVQVENNVLRSNVQNILNESFEEYGETVLHIASRLAQTSILRTLLEAGADPAIKDCKGRVPFNVAKDKETRSEFRRFMAAYPDKYDYKKAQIPSPLTTEMEEEKSRKAAEKKKAQSKARKQRLKVKKAEEKRKEDELLKKEQKERERNWFQNLSDREKRAVAAERRLGNICFNCSRSLQGLVPFERLSYKYCSTECVHKHRQVLETAVK